MEELEALQWAVEKLHPKPRMALFLRYEDKLTYEEIAARLNVRPLVAVPLLRRAEEYLKECADEYPRERAKPVNTHA